MGYFRQNPRQHSPKKSLKWEKTGFVTLFGALDGRHTIIPGAV